MKNLILAFNSLKKISSMVRVDTTPIKFILQKRRKLGAKVIGGSLLLL